MPTATGKCPACGLRMGVRLKERVGMYYRCRKCKTALRLEGHDRGLGSVLSVLPNEHGELKLQEIPRV